MHDDIQIGHTWRCTLLCPSEHTNPRLSEPQLHIERSLETLLEVAVLSFPVIWMNECAPNRGLEPLVKSQSEVIECDTVDEKTFATWSVHRN